MRFTYDPNLDSLTIDYGDGMTVVYERSEYLNVEYRDFDGFP